MTKRYAAFAIVSGEIVWLATYETPEEAQTHIAEELDDMEFLDFTYIQEVFEFKSVEETDGN